MKYTIDLSVKQLLEEPVCRKVLEEHLPNVLPMLQEQENAQGISLRKLGQYLPQFITQKRLDEINAALSIASPPEGTLSEAEQKKVAEYHRLANELTPARLLSKSTWSDCIHPGMPWYDTEGKRIQAHGGYLFFENGRFYWYGENKEKTDETSDIWTWGIRAYVSEDLCNWEDLGLIIPPVLDDPNSSFFPDKKVDRPHILHCTATGKYICWLKLSGKEACFVVLQSDHLLGPYKIVRDTYRPFELEVGDFDVIVEENTGNAYLFMDGNHNGVYGLRLSSDYTVCEKIVSRQYQGLKPPFTREGITLFEYAGKKYLLTSGMTGYIPNQSDVAVSDSWETPFVSLGDPYVNDETMASFNSQVSQILRLPSGQYLSLADRWLPGYLLDGKKAKAIRYAVAASTDSKNYSATDEDQAEFRKMPSLERTDTAISDYVWLPVTFVNEMPQICWHDQWKPEINKKDKMK